MNFAVISDIHLGLDGYSKRGDLRKLGSQSERLAKEFVEEMNNNIHPSFAIQLGDVIDDRTIEEDRKNYQYVLELLAELKCPLYHVIGNHDTKKLSEAELKQFTNQAELHYSFDADNYHGIVLFSKRDKMNDLTISPQQVEWLAEDLAQTDLKTIIFSHHSLADQDLAGNYWFEGLPEHCLIKNRAAIRTVLEESGKVASAMNGHLHWNHMDVHNGIPYFTIQSLVENFKGDGTPSASYAVVNVDPKQIKVEVMGNDSAKHLFNDLNLV
jgi:3',5'-cyclic-AMP phosphodiesterase